jgi:hypothetical protein
MANSHRNDPQDKEQEKDSATGHSDNELRPGGLEPLRKTAARSVGVKQLRLTLRHGIPLQKADQIPRSDNEYSGAGAKDAYQNRQPELTRVFDDRFDFR